MEVADIGGRLLALSHTFRICSEDMFFMEMCCGNKIHHIIVRRHSQLAWHQSLEIRSRYRITNLKTFILFKDKYNIPVLLATRLSTLTQLEDDERDDDLDVKQDKDLISYKGTITNVVDEEAGIYELDGRHRLIVSCLIDFAGELYSENLAESRTCKSLEKGDAITVYHAHYLRISGIFHLICCARSLVRKIRKTPVHMHNKRSESSIVDSVHLYNPGIRGIIWLLALQNSLISALCPEFVDEKLIRRRKWNGRKSLLSNLIKEGARRNLLNRESRSLYQEFMSHYQCIVDQDFVAPFTAVTLDSLKTNINPESVAGCEAPILWHHVVDGNESKVLVGKLVCGDSGVLQVCQQTSQVPLDLLIVGNKENIFHKVGAVVALFNFSVVIEEFNIFGKISVESVCKRYIMIKSSDVVILKESINIPQELIASSEMGSLYNIKIISKSCIVFNNFQSSKGVSGNEICDVFFIARAVVTRMQQRTMPDEMRQTFVRFSGSNALIHSCIQDGHQCVIKIPESVNAELLMKKTHSNSWLRPLQSHFGTCECLYIPECVSVIDVTNENYHQTELSVTQILKKPEFDNHGLISVIGTVKERAHMTPKFISEVSCFTIDVANKYHVGVPGSKIIRVLLEDQENSNDEIWLYLNSTSNNFIQHYPLGIIPGVSIIASSVKRNVSKANKVYLQGTVFTCLVPIALPAPISNLPHRKRKKFVFLRNAPQHGAFVCFATVGRIIKVSLKSVCCFCNSDMVEGSCTYVGCHAQPTGKIVAAAQVIIDDGTSTALVFIDSVDQVQILLQLSHQQFKLLENNIISGFHQLTYLSIKRRDHGLGNSQILLESVPSKVFEKLCSNDQLLRPLKFSCRRFSSQSQGSSRYKDRLHLYCLELSEIHPNVDSETLVKRAKN